MLVGKDPVSPRPLDARAAWFAEGKAWLACLARKALELDTAEARSFDSLYAWCEATVDRRDFIGPARCLRSLRHAWCRASEPRSITLRSDRPLS